MNVRKTIIVSASLAIAIALITFIGCASNRGSVLVDFENRVIKAKTPKNPKSPAHVQVNPFADPLTWPAGVRTKWHEAGEPDPAAYAVSLGLVSIDASSGDSFPTPGVDPQAKAWGWLTIAGAVSIAVGVAGLLAPILGLVAIPWLLWLKLIPRGASLLLVLIGALFISMPKVVVAVWWLPWAMLGGAAAVYAVSLFANHSQHKKAKRPPAEPSPEDILKLAQAHATISGNLNK